MKSGETKKESVGETGKICPTAIKASHAWQGGGTGNVLWLPAGGNSGNGEGTMEFG